MKYNLIIVVLVIITVFMMSCKKHRKAEKLESPVQKQKEVTAKEILGNSDYLAISYGGYRATSRAVQPSIAELKDDLKILSAMGVKIVRTYNVQLPFPHASNVLKAISELKKEDSNFEMYVMLGAWIDCLNAWTDQPVNHNVESPNNQSEIERAVALANQYPDIVKVIAVGNEAMIKWATSYYVEPHIILKWVNHLQDLKIKGKLSKDLWITSSDDYTSWGGGDASYHTEDLEQLVKAVDYISMHSYPFHNTYYNPDFWRVPEGEGELTDIEKVDAAMKRAIGFAQQQYDSVANYIKSLGVNKPIHIGETGWATTSKGFYGANGSKATDEYKQSLYYKQMRNWTNKAGISCFYFEAFNEQWKDAQHPDGSENHFGLFTISGQAKYPIWDMVDQGVFNGLTRNGNPITKTFEGDRENLMSTVLVPPSINDK